VLLTLQVVLHIIQHPHQLVLQIQLLAAAAVRVLIAVLLIQAAAVQPIMAQVVQELSFLDTQTQKL
jgi:hypothetical protein